MDKEVLTGHVAKDATANMPITTFTNQTMVARQINITTGSIVASVPLPRIVPKAAIGIHAFADVSINWELPVAANLLVSSLDVPMVISFLASAAARMMAKTAMALRS